MGKGILTQRHGDTEVAKVRLGDVFDLQMGKTPARANELYWGGGNKWISIADIGKASMFISQTKETISDKAVEDSGIKQIPAGTLIMSFKLSIGKVAITAEPMYSNEAIMSFRDIGKCLFDVHYLYHQFANRDWTSGVNKAVMGTTLNKASLSTQEILLHPLVEQKRIAAELDLITEMIRNREAQLARLDTLVRARFDEMFGDPVSNPKGWPTASVGEVAASVRYGTSRSAQENGDHVYLRMNNVTSEGELDLANIKRITVPANELENCVVRYGDVIFNRTNSKELVGKTCLFKLKEQMVIAGYLIRLRFKNSISPFYFSALMNQASIKKMLSSMAKGAVNQANISASELREIIIPLPPLALQKEFAAVVEEVDKSKAAIKKTIENLKTLYKARLQEYFA